MLSFSPDDFQRITAAVQAAEQRTSGEIVPFFVERSDTYDEAAWRAAVIFGATVLLMALFLRLFANAWLPVSLIELCFASLGFGALGFLLAAFVPSATRVFAGKSEMEHRVHQRAREAFLSEEVFKTRERTGILLFMSMLERRVVVLGDAGINARVEPSQWNDIVQIIVRGMRSGKPADALVDAIGRCGALLEQRGLRRPADDRDELADGLRTEKR